MSEATTLLSGTIGWTLLIIFGLLWIGLGLWWGRKAKDAEGFMVAGRNVGLALGTATAMATWVTSNTIMLAPVFALEKGLWGMLAYCTASLGLMLFAPMAFRIHQLLPKGFTSGDFMRLRFGRGNWSVFLIISLIYSMAWLVTMAVAGGYLLQALSGIPYQYGMSAILLVCVIYTLFGGLYAVIGTDFIQSVIILIGVVVIGAVVLTRVGVGEVYLSVTTHQPALLDVFMPVALLALFNNMFFGFGEVFHNNVWWSRAYAMRKRVASRAFFISGLMWLPIPLAAGFIALCAGPLGVNVVNVNMVGPLLAGHVLGPLGAILVFIVVFCSLASSIDSLLAATSDLLTRDIYGKWINPQADPNSMRRQVSIIIVLLGFLTWLIALPGWNLLDVLFISGPLVGSAIAPIVAGLYWENANRQGVLIAMLAGSAAGLIAYFTIGWFVASLIATALSLLIVALTTWLMPQRFDWSQLDESRLNPNPRS